MKIPIPTLLESGVHILQLAKTPQLFFLKSGIDALQKASCPNLCAFASLRLCVESLSAIGLKDV